MTLSEQKEFDQLREQLADAEQRKAFFSSVVTRLKEEARLYRNLFWALLGFAIIAATWGLLQR